MMSRLPEVGQASSAASSRSSDALVTNITPRSSPPNTGQVGCRTGRSSSRLTRLAPDGSVSLELDLPVLQPTCPVFGGEDLGVMFVTSASEDMDEAALEAWPASGSLLIISAPEDVTGLPAPRYRAPLAGLQTRG